MVGNHNFVATVAIIKRFCAKSKILRTDDKFLIGRGLGSLTIEPFDVTLFMPNTLISSRK